MSLTMTEAERQTFLADLHVGVMGIADGDRGPLTVPVWYSYEPGGDVIVLTGETSRKMRLAAAAGRFSLCAQTESLPYRYVMVEGPVVEISTTGGVMGFPISGSGARHTVTVSGDATLTSHDLG